MSDPGVLLDQFKAAYNNHDHRAMAALYSETAVSHEPGREPIRGRSAIGSHWAEMCEAFPDAQVTYTELLSLAVPFVTAITVGAGEVVSQRVYLDQAEIARQLRPG